MKKFIWFGIIYISTKHGGLFCFVVMKFTELGCFRSCVLGVFGKLSMTRAAWGCGVKVLEY